MLNRKLMGPNPSVPSDRPGRPPGEIFLFAVTDISLSKIYFEHVLGAAALLFLPMAILLAKGIAPGFAAAGLAVLVLGLVRNRTVPLDLGPVISSLGALSVWALFKVLVVDHAGGNSQNQPFPYGDFFSAEPSFLPRAATLTDGGRKPLKRH